MNIVKEQLLPLVVRWLQPPFVTEKVGWAHVYPSGSDKPEKEAQGVEKATLQSTSFVMTQTVHEDAKECIENTRQVIEDCPDPVGRGRYRSGHRGRCYSDDRDTGEGLAFDWDVR